MNLFKKNCKPLLLFLFLFCPFAYSKVSSFWTGIAGIIIKDETATLVFDVTLTRPNIFNWILNRQYISNTHLVKETFSKLQINHVDGIFASHTHFDHAVDLPAIANLFRGTLHGAESLKNLTTSYAKIHKLKTLQFQDMISENKIVVGAFTITPFIRSHSSIIQFIDWDFLPGSFSSDSTLAFFDYKVGETWAYLIEHPKGKVFIDQGSQPDRTILAKLPHNISYAFIGVANKKSIVDFVDGYGKTFKDAKEIIPMHFDWFLMDLFYKPAIMPGMELDKFPVALIESGSKAKWSIPILFEEKILFQ